MESLPKRLLWLVFWLLMLMVSWSSLVLVAVAALVGVKVLVRLVPLMLIRVRTLTPLVSEFPRTMVLVRLLKGRKKPMARPPTKTTGSRARIPILEKKDR